MYERRAPFVVVAIAARAAGASHAPRIRARLEIEVRLEHGEREIHGEEAAEDDEEGEVDECNQRRVRVL